MKAFFWNKGGFIVNTLLSHHHAFSIWFMRSFEMNVNGPWTKGSAELNHHAQDEQKNIRDKVVGEGHGLSEEDESRINEDVEDLNDGRIGSVQAVQGVLHGPQQQPQGPIVRWERFLPLRSLKVLLVENDNSTRQVVSALLRNCSYEGLQLVFDL